MWASKCPLQLFQNIVISATFIILQFRRITPFDGWEALRTNLFAQSFAICRAIHAGNEWCFRTITLVPILQQAYPMQIPYSCDVRTKEPKLWKKYVVLLMLRHVAHMQINPSLKTRLAMVECCWSSRCKIKSKCTHQHKCQKWIRSKPLIPPQHDDNDGTLGGNI